MPPQMETSRIKSTVITHKEYITDVVSSTASNSSLVLNTNLFAYPIQPANSTTFPWLSTVAQNYQEYRILGMVFEYKSTCGSAISGTNNAMGSVLMSTQYRASDPAFTNKQQMDNEQYAVDVVPWSNTCHFIECSPHQSPLDTLYTRSAPVTTDSPELYDLGTFYIATCGQQASSVVLGELWCSYQVELLKPQLAIGSSSDAGSILTWHGLSVSITSGTPCNAVSTTSNSNYVCTTSSNSVTIPPGTFSSGDLIQMQYLLLGGSGVTIVTPSLSITNLNAYNIFNANSSSVFTIPPNASASSEFAIFKVGLIANGALPTTFTFGTAGTMPTSGASLDIFIFQMLTTIN